jgi:hypothetical protein
MDKPDRREHKEPSANRVRLNTIRDALMDVAAKHELGQLVLEAGVGYNYDTAASYAFKRAVVTVHLLADAQQSKNMLDRIRLAAEGAILTPKEEELNHAASAR